VIILVYAAAAWVTWGAGVERGWSPIFLMLATVANIGLTVMLVGEARKRGKPMMALLFVINIAMVFALQPIAQMPDKSIAIHWFEQTLTAGGAAAFAYASWLLLRSTVRTQTAALKARAAAI
jgi:hypothetical protein